VDLGSGKSVRGALERSTCDVLGNPTSKTVCLSIQGDGSAGKCASEVSSGAAEVFEKYVPGATYVMTGKGCVNLFVDPRDAPQRVCQTFGPTYYTL
jgi:hypothetical protein